MIKVESRWSLQVQEENKERAYLGAGQVNERQIP